MQFSSPPSLAPIRFIFAFWLAWLAIPALAATPSPEVARGTQWLAAQVDADGALAGEAGSLAAAFQARTETEQTLQRLSSAPAKLIDAIAAEDASDTEYLARQAIILSLAGRSAAAPVAELLVRSNTDGGFGGAPGAGSTLLDTAWAVLALAGSHPAGVEEAALGREYLAYALAADGSPAAGSRAGDLETGALALLALRSSTDGLAVDAARQLSTWLLQQQGGDGGWDGDLYLSALTLAALAPALTDNTVFSTASSFLLARQSADGSWFNDPFLTAVALRALTARPAAVQPPTGSGSFTALVIDRVTRTPLGGAAVTLAGPTAASGVTDTNGHLTLTGLGAGAYTGQLSRAGYTDGTVSFTLGGGQNLDLGNISLTQLATSGILRGKVSAANGAPLAGAAVAVSGAYNGTTLTDAAGGFEFSTVTPGALSMTASLAGYQGVAATATLAAGQTLIFSPMLYPTGAAVPTTGRFIGQVVDQESGAALAGVAISLNGSLAGSSGADGRFDLTLPAASYQADLTLAGYSPVALSFTLTAGATADAGTLRLSPQRTGTTIRGKVLDTGGHPVPNATVQLIGGASTRVAADGSYRFADLPGTRFDLRAAAEGYSSQQMSVQISEPTEVALDFTLQATQSLSLNLGPLTVTPANAGADVEIAVETTLTNGGADAASGVMRLQVSDAAGHVVGTGAAYDANNILLGTVALEPGQGAAIRLRWNTALNASGSYTLAAQVVEPGSATRENPTGTLITQRAAQATITPEQRILGSITADPPVLRAGLNTPVKLTALLQNNGNTELPAQEYRLRIVDRTSGEELTRFTLAGARMPVFDLQTLDFGAWTPAKGGDYRLELTAVSPATAGLIEGKVYVGDSAGAGFTASPQTIPSGTRTVRGQVAITGQDVAQGSISDPLAPAIKAAIQRSVTLNDEQARQWTLGPDKCQGCHIQTQALVGGELNRRFASFDPLYRATIFNSTSVNLRATGSLSDGYHDWPWYDFPTTMTTLGLWALTSHHDQSGIASTLKRASDLTVERQSSEGHWHRDFDNWYYEWFSSDISLTAFNIKNLIAVHSLLGQIDPQYVRNYSTRPYATELSRTSRGFMHWDATGNLYFPVLNAGQVVQQRPDGTIGTIWSGLFDPRSIREIRGGLVAATEGGIYRLNADGTSQFLSPIRAFDLAETPDGRVFATTWRGELHFIDQDWKSPAMWRLVWGALAHIKATPDGGLLIANYSGRNILRISPDIQVSAVVELTNGNPLDVIADGDDWLVATTTGLYRYNQAWEGERLLFERIDQIMRLPNGTLVGAIYGAENLVEIVDTPADLPPSITRYEEAIVRATDWLMHADVSTNENAMHLAHRMIGLGEARKYFESRDPARAAALGSHLASLAEILRGRQLEDGGWGAYPGYGSDSMVTAQVGMGLDYLDPSPDDSVVRKAVELLLARQQGDGSWMSENGILSTRLAATTWVSIWLPIMLDRIGGIDTTLTLTTRPDVTLSNPDLAPASTQANPDGSTTYRWNLVGVTAEGRTVGFDLTLADLLPNEERAVATEAHLTFSNSFTHQPVESPIDVPKVKASAFLELGLATDRLEYAGNTPLTAIAQVTNTADAPRSGSVAFAVQAPDGTRIAQLGTLPFTGLAAGATVGLNAGWNTGTTLAGPGYAVVATLFDAAGNPVVTATAPFVIVAGPAGSSAVSLRTTTDRALYHTTDTVRIDNLVRNLSVNLRIPAATLRIRVLAPDGGERFADASALGELLPGSDRNRAFPVALNAAAIGDYRVLGRVEDEAGTLLASAETGFRVAEDPVRTLSGAVTVAAPTLRIGDPQSCTYTIGHQGLQPLAGLAVRRSLVRVDQPAEIALFAESLDLTGGADVVRVQNYATAELPAGDYACVLEARPAGAWITLGHALFTLTPATAALQLEGRFEVGGGGRLLILLDPSNNAPDPLGTPRWPTTAEQRRFLEALLTAAGWSYTIVEDADAFAHAFYTGGYTLYLLASERQKLAEPVQSALREAVYRGEGLVVAGRHDARDARIDPALGILYRGKFSNATALALEESPLHPAAELPFTFPDKALRIDPNGASTVGRFRYRGKLAKNQSDAAVTLHAYGQGASVYTGYDLLAEATLAGSASLHADLLLAALAQVDPAPKPAWAGGLLPLTLTVENLGAATPGRFLLPLPAGATLLDAPGATWFEDADGVTVTAAFDLGEAERIAYPLRLQLPWDGLPFTLEALLQTGLEPEFRDHATARLDLAPAPLPDLAVLTARARTLGSAYQPAANALQRAQAALARNDGTTALAELLKAADHLAAMTQPDPALRLDLARLIGAVARRTL